MAAREIKTTLALDGEKQFKAGMDDAYRAMKVLGSELKANTAEFGKSAQSMDGLTKRGEILRKEITQQKEIVAALTKAVADSSAAYGENDKRTDAYRIKLNNATAALANMENELGANQNAIDNFGQETEKAEKKTESWRETLKKVDEQLDKSIGFLGKVTAGIAAVGAAAIAAGTQLFDLTAETGRWADELITTSTQTGISTTTLQEWGYAAQFIDTEVETMTGAMARMTRQLLDVQAGTGASAEAFATLGVSVIDNSGKLLDSEEIFMAVIDALGQVGNATERDALAMQIFGKSAQELNPLIVAGSDQLRTLGAEAQAAGIIMGETNVAQMGAFDDKMNVLNSTIGGMRNSVALALSPAMERIIEVVQQVANKFSEWLNSEAAKTLIGQLTDKIIALADRISGDLDGTMEAIIGAFQTAGDVIGFVIENIDTIITVISTLTIVLGTLKIAQLAVNIAMSANPIGLVITAIGFLIAAVVAIIQNWDACKKAISDAWENIKRAFSAGVDAVVGFINTVISWFGNLITGAWNAGKNLVAGLWDGIKSAAPWLWEQITGWLGGIWNGIKGFFGIKSPSTLMANTVGKPIVQGIALGITKNSGLVDDAMLDLVPSAVHSNVSLDVTRRFSDVMNTKTRSRDTLVDAIREAMGDQVIVLNDREFGRAVRKVAMA